MSIDRILHRFSRRKHDLGFSNCLPAEQRPSLLEINKWDASKLILGLMDIVGYHPYPFDEIMLMIGAFQYHLPDIVIDIGTHMGKSARIWYELARHFQTKAEVHTIDIFDPQHVEYPGQVLGKYIQGLPVTQHIEDGFTCATKLISEAPEASFLIFLDGDHSYESVSRELKLATLIRRGGLLVHDTFYQPDSVYNHGPYLAIQDFGREFAFQQIIHLQLGLPGMSYLKVG